MMRTTVQSDGQDDAPATELAAPSADAPTRTSEPSRDAQPTPTAHVPAARVCAPDRYQLLGEHGRGGLGRVSRAHDRDLGRDVAIKELISRGHLGEVRFLREALITARLEHPGIVPVHEAGRWPDGTPFYAMKLVAGRPLRDLLAERTSVDDRIGLLHHVIAVADAIAYAHGRSIIHRDLKPSNVIVGEFGETVVIDWGLAKDLTVAEESIIGGGPFRTAADDGLTSAGSVLGTPAYMAPEQARGETVDQRADVFAIGAMLWELCTLQKLPPDLGGERRRILRRAGIDQDLMVIIDKAVDPDPARRYPHAGALAADLKAFKAGVRIAARRYSLLALLGHWTRRHRALTASTAAALLLLVAGIGVYVRNITAERDRADTSEKDSRQARAAAESTLDALKLKHAELLLTKDPSAAIDVVATYRGSDREYADQIRAEAAGRGAAALRASPHTNNILWAEDAHDGGVLSLSIDGTISRTSPDGSSTVVARGVAQVARSSYSPKRHLLAYTCDPSDICLLDTQHEIRLNTPPHFNNANAVGISFSPNGTQLALMSNAAILTVFDISDPAQPRLRLSTSIQGGVDVLFIAEDVLAAGTQSGVAFVHANGTSEPLNVPNSSHWDANITERRLALATTDGLAYVIRSDPARITLKHRLCNSPIVGLFFLPSRQDVAYACRDGIVGIWNLDLNLAKISMRLEDHVDRIAVGADGDNIVAAGTNGRIAIFDLTTGLTARYDGHEYRLTALRAPAASSPHLISADARGAIRVWARSPKFARVIATSAVPFNQAIFNSQTDAIVATSWNPTLTTYSPSTGIGSVGPHERYNIFIEQAIDGQRFATFGPGDNVEIWSQTMSRLATIQTGHGSISQLRFMHETSDLLTAGNDGRLMRWAIAEQRASLIATLHQPIDILFSEGSNLPIIFATSDGVLWHADRDGKVASSGSTGSRITAISSTKKAGSIYVGYSSGLVEIVDTRSWAHRPILNTSAKVRKILPTSRNGSLLVTTDNGNVYFGDSKDDSEIAWTTSMIHVRDIAITPDDLVVAVGSNGAIWATTATNRTWLYAATVRTDFRYLSIDQGGNRGVATETGGDLILIDLNEIRKALAENSHL